MIERLLPGTCTCTSRNEANHEALRSTPAVHVHVPAGCANAFLTLENNTIVNYLMGDYYNKKYDCGFNFKSEDFKVKWPLKPVVISKKDLNLPDFNQRFN